jgi:hypothetical protein
MLQSNNDDHELEAWFEAQGLVRDRKPPDDPCHPSPDSLSFSNVSDYCLLAFFGREVEAKVAPKARERSVDGVSVPMFS